MFTIGARMDRYSPDFWGRDSGNGPLTHEKAKNNGGLFNGSVSYRTPFHLTPYFTAATSRFLDLGQGNEIDASEIPGGTYVQPSTLYEGGVKTERRRRSSSRHLGFYRQKRSAWDSQTLSLDYFKSKGAGIGGSCVPSEAPYPDGRRYVAGTATTQCTVSARHPRQPAGPYARTGYGGKFEGVANIFPHQGAYPVAGQPHWVASPFGTLNITKNVGFLIGTTWVASVKAGYVSTVVLPSYALSRGSRLLPQEEL